MSLARRSLSEIIFHGLTVTNSNWNNSLVYHNAVHATSVMDAILEILNHTEHTQLQRDNLLSAAAWHDAVYIPGSKTNEHDSATKFLWYYAYSDTIDSEIVAQMIRSTTVADHLTENPDKYTINQKILLDADLYSLSLDYDRFVRNQELILMENGLTFKDIGKCVEFLNQFLTVRPSIYHTEYARNHWESLARENIKKLGIEYDKSNW